MKFTTPCFIRKNTPGLRKKLEDLGYKVHPHFTQQRGIALLAMNGYFAEIPEIVYMGIDIIDCGDHIELFLALAALREDSDKHQLFICTKGCLNNNEGDIEKCVIEELNNPNYRKLTPTELIEHFKNNE